MPAVAQTPTKPETYTAVPLAGLVAKDPVPFSLYLRTANNVWVLYRPAASPLDESHVGRLLAEGIGQLFIRDHDRAAYFHRVEASLDQMLLDRHMPVERRTELLYGVAVRVADDLLKGPPDRPAVHRAQKVMMATSGLLLRETNAFHAIRRVLASGQTLATHSLTVGFLAMGLARNVLAADAGTLALAGLGGLLHDVGRVGYEGIDHDPEHTIRGASMLAALGVPRPVIEAARSHHERHDGSGFPDGLDGAHMPEIARVVSLANTFDKIYSSQQPRVGIFDALRILAQAYRGCFDEQLAQGFVKLFR